MYNVKILEAATRIESIQYGIAALGEMIQVVDLDTISDDAMKNFGSVLMILSEVTLEALSKLDRESGNIMMQPKRGGTND